MPWVNPRGLLQKWMALSWQPKPPLNGLIPEIPHDAIILDIGAGGRRITKDTITVDCNPSFQPDVVSDATKLPFPSDYAHFIICTGLLEIIEHPDKVISEIYRVLKPGGIVHIEVSYIQPYHPDPTDYWRWTLKGIRLFCKRAGFSEVRSGAHIGPSSAIAFTVDAWFPAAIKHRWIRRPLRALVRLFIGLFKYMDKFVINNSNCHIAAAGVYFTGKKGDEYIHSNR